MNIIWVLAKRVCEMVLGGGRTGWKLATLLGGWSFCISPLRELQGRGSRRESDRSKFRPGSRWRGRTAPWSRGSKVPSSVTKKLGGGQSRPTALQGCSFSAKEARPVAFGSFSSLVPAWTPAASLPGKKGNLETIKAKGFHFQGAGWGRLLPGGLSRAPPRLAGAKGGTGGVGPGPREPSERLPLLGVLLPELSGRPAS